VVLSLDDDGVFNQRRPQMKSSVQDVTVDKMEAIDDSLLRRLLTTNHLSAVTLSTRCCFCFDTHKHCINLHHRSGLPETKQNLFSQVLPWVVVVVIQTLASAVAS